MKTNQLTQGESRRVMYVENKNGDIDGSRARIGWVEFSKSGRTVYYRGRKLQRANGISGNHIDVVSGEEYWVSGVKKRGSNAHWAETIEICVDDDALDEYERQKKGRS